MVTITARGHTHSTVDGHDERLVRLEEAVAQRNDHLAWLKNRGFFQRPRSPCVELRELPRFGKNDAPGAHDRGVRARVGPVRHPEGDQATGPRRGSAFGERARPCGVESTPGRGCHLERREWSRASVRRSAPAIRAASWPSRTSGTWFAQPCLDLGEGARIALLSVAEGSDKPLKYPYLFRGAELVLINKVDLLPYVDFDMQDCLSGLKQVNPDVEVIQISARSGVGVAGWYAWLAQRALAAVRGSQPGILR